MRPYDNLRAEIAISLIFNSELCHNLEFFVILNLAPNVHAPLL